mmetsp:Transcript_45417/g.49105  ORF Transcript_45417/g.49105 Transcript_45417/m.49105 type:complete len:280 (+) Transcript_45417:130-969(+)
MSFSPSHHHQQLNHRCHLHTSTRKFSREPQAPSPSQSQHPMLPQLLSYAAVLERSAAAHVYAQQLNNVASLCLEVGQYDKAISSLGKALRLSELHIVDQLLDRAQACTCHDCSLDGCITYSETSASNVNHANLQNKMMVVEDCDPEEEGGGGRRRGGYRFVSILIVVLLSLVSAWQEHGVVSALQMIQRLLSPSFSHHHPSSTAVASQQSLSSVWVPSSQEDDEVNQSIDDLLSSSSFDVYSISGGFHNLEEESFDPVRMTRLCDNDRSHSQRSTRIIQ